MVIRDYLKIYFYSILNNIHYRVYSIYAYSCKLSTFLLLNDYARLPSIA